MCVVRVLGMLVISELLMNRMCCVLCVFSCCWVMWKVVGLGLLY